MCQRSAILLFKNFEISWAEPNEVNEEEGKKYPIAREST